MPQTLLYLMVVEIVPFQAVLLSSGKRERGGGVGGQRGGGGGRELKRARGAPMSVPAGLTVLVGQVVNVCYHINERRRG